MSTRAMMAVYENENEKIKYVQAFIYRHSDGYPKGVLPEILPFVEEFNNNRGLGETEYATARLLQHLTNAYDQLRKDSAAKYKLSSSGDDAFKFLGYGISNTLHGDIEYFYHISPTAVLVYEVSGNDCAAWKMIERVPLKAKVAGGI